jgi:hypothetical protein
MDNPRIDTRGNKWWYDSDGKYHRDDGPAIIFEDEHKVWYQHDKRHRDDGPAVEYANGSNEWWLNDELLTFDEWLDKVNMSDEDKVFMKLQHG